MAWLLILWLIGQGWHLKIHAELASLIIPNADKSGQFNVIKSAAPFSVAVAIGHAFEAKNLNGEEFDDKRGEAARFFERRTRRAHGSQRMILHSSMSFADMTLAGLKIPRNAQVPQLPLGADAI